MRKIEWNLYNLRFITATANKWNDYYEHKKLNELLY